jgi:multidrug efflux pump subunit AcrA (membrane-fusion protein)
MAVIHHLYATTDQAAQAVAALQQAGVQRTNLSLISAAPLNADLRGRLGTFVEGDGHDHDARAERVGSFADGDGHDHVTPDAPQGGFAGDTRHAPMGSFADVDRDIVTSFVGGMHEANVSTHQQIGQMLSEAGVPAADIQAYIDSIHQGKAIVLVQVAEHDVERASSVLAQY